MSFLRNQIAAFLAAVIFLTRIPVRLDVPFHGDLMARSAMYFPLVGGLVGVIAGGVLLGANAFLPAEPSALLAVFVAIVITGALHEDGLADTCDALGGNSVEQRLEIMRDSRIGTFGTLALVGSVALRVCALMPLDPRAGFVALFVAHGVSRCVLPGILVSDRYARSSGAGRSIAGRVTRPEALIAGAIGMTQALTAGFVEGLLALAVGLAAATVVLVMTLRLLGGYTGDSLGAVQQAAEIAVLLALVAIWS